LALPGQPVQPVLPEAALRVARPAARVAVLAAVRVVAEWRWSRRQWNLNSARNPQIQDSVLCTQYLVRSFFMSADSKLRAPRRRGNGITSRMLAMP